MPQQAPLRLIWLICIMPIACGDGEPSRVAPRIQSAARTRLGALQANGAFNLCPQIDPLSAAPLEADVGSSIALEATASDPDTAPRSLSLQWKASNGWKAIGFQAQFPCSQSGTFTIAATVSDGDSGCLSGDSEEPEQGATAIVDLTCVDAP